MQRIEDGIEHAMSGSPAGSESLAVSPKRACIMLDCGITRLYELINAGELVTYHEGRHRKITVESIRAHIARRIAECRSAPERP